MKKILSLFLLAVLFIGMFSIPISASSNTAAAATSESTGDELIDEMKSNLESFNPDAFAKSGGSPMVLGASLTSYVDETDDPLFNIYVYMGDPVTAPNRPFAFFDFKATNDAGAEFTKNYNSSTSGVTTFLNKRSDDNLFGRFSIYLSNICPDYKKYNDFSFHLTRLKGYIGREARDLKFDMNFNFKRNSEDGSYQVTSSKQNLVTLDVETTSYRIGTVGTDLNRKYEIFTAYFSLPDEYIETYERLYSVKAHTWKKKTSPIIWGNYNPWDVYGPVGLPQNFISKKYDMNTNPDTLITDVWIPWISNFRYDNTMYTRYFYEDIYDGDLLWYFYKEDGANGVVTEEEILDYFENNPLNDSFSKEEWEKVLFASSKEIFPEKTIDDTFDALNYFQNADFMDYWEDFGLWKATLAWLYKDSPDKIKELIGENLIDVNSDEFINNACNLVLLSESDRIEALKLNDEELCERFLIGDSDASSFREYLANNKNVVLFRFDVEEYRSMELIRPKSSDSLVSDGYSYAMCEKYMYFDFEVIDVTFFDKGEYVSLGVGSIKQDVVGDDVEVEEPDGPGFTPNPDWKEDVGDDLKDEFDDMVGDLGNIFGQFTSTVGGYLGTFFGGFFDALGWVWTAIIIVIAILGIILVIKFFQFLGGSGTAQLMSNRQKNKQFDKELTFKQKNADREYAMQQRDFDYRSKNADRDFAFKSKNADREYSFNVDNQNRNFKLQQDKQDHDFDLRYEDLNLRKKEMKLQQDKQDLDFDLKYEDLNVRKKDYGLRERETKLDEKRFNLQKKEFDLKHKKN